MWPKWNKFSNGVHNHEIDDPIIMREEGLNELYKEIESIHEGEWDDGKGKKRAYKLIFMGPDKDMFRFIALSGAFNLPVVHFDRIDKVHFALSEKYSIKTDPDITGIYRDDKGRKRVWLGGKGSNPTLENFMAEDLAVDIYERAKKYGLRFKLTYGIVKGKFSLRRDLFLN